MKREKKKKRVKVCLWIIVWIIKKRNNVNNGIHRLMLSKSGFDI
jgi:hypothetical protein